jgi:hypothetical protein
MKGWLKKKVTIGDGFGKEKIKIPIFVSVLSWKSYICGICVFSCCSIFLVCGKLARFIR